VSNCPQAVETGVEAEKLIVDPEGAPETDTDCANMVVEAIMNRSRDTPQVLAINCRFLNRSPLSFEFE
jgi:hypothetical protein